MRNKLFFTGLVSALLIFAIFAGCDNGTTTKDVVVVTAPGPVITMEGPKETVEVPGQNAGDLRKALQAAQDKLIADPSATPPVVVITGQIPIQANSSITVPDYVTLQIRKGARLTVEANALFFVKEHAVVDVQGELYFEQFANGDDVRQAKIVGKVIANGGTIYDKSDQGLLLQYVSSIKDGGRLAFGGGQQVAGGAVTRERYLLGTANFKGEIKLKFSDGWTVYNPIIINPDAAATGNENILVWPEVTADVPALGLKGFEVVSDLEITEGEMIIPDKSLIVYAAVTPGDARTNDFIIKTGVTVTIAKGASLITQNADADKVSGLILEEQAKLVVNGKLGLPSRTAGKHPTSTNLGTITVNAGGTILDDGAAFGNAFDQSLATSGPTQKKGTIILMPGSIAMYNRAAPTIYASQGGTGDIKSGAATKIEMTDLLYKITGGVAEVNSQFTLPT